MDVKAYYFEANEKFIEGMQNSSDEDRVDYLEIIQDLHKVKYYAMGKWWDALHYLLTGVSASEPIEYSALSEAIVGKRLFDENENATFIAYTPAEDLKKIYAALDWLKVKEVMESFSLEELKQKDIYPCTWDEDKLKDYKQELAGAFKTLRHFYQIMVEEEKSVVIAIY